MTKVDLITGFLGAGKTTFIRHYLDWMKSKGEKVHIIENEFGSAGIDAMLLEDEDDHIDDLSGACMCCTGLEKFKQMMLDAADSGYSRILVEPSGIYDVDEFFGAIKDERVRQYCEIGSIITVVDGKMDRHVTQESRYLMFTQLLAAGTIVMSKVQLYDRDILEETKTELLELMRYFGGKKNLDACLVEKDWENLTDEDFEKMQGSGFYILDHKRHPMDHGTVFQAVIRADSVEDKEGLARRLDALFQNEKGGIVWRVKGYIKDLQGQWYEMNCTPEVRYIVPCKRDRGVFVIIGQDLDEEKIAEEAFIPRKLKKGK